VAYSPDDTLAAVTSSPQLAIYCVSNGLWTTPPIQTVTYQTPPFGVTFAPCKDFAAVIVTGSPLRDPGTVINYQVNDSVCQP